ncbi:glycosyltransferase family 39 protein [Candidatus Woesearchaeota archaeon]|nr:glycosyltransferase family 39 protein [Candidatus Woesearchaeota archaeon]
MKLNKNYIQTFIFILVYLFAIYFWSQPYQERKLPYGEYDAMSHFEVADYMAYNDKSFQKLPPYIDLRYGLDNKFKPHTLWYPPPFHTSLGIIEVIAGDRVIPIFLLNTIMSTFVIISVYFVVNSLFGFLPAILSALLIIFSPRDFMPYLWGQWPERFAYAFVPIILYCFYKYLINYSKEDKKPTYLYLTALFLGINLLVHPLVFFHSILGIAVLYVFLAIKKKKIIFNWKHSLIAAIIFLVIFLLFPYQTFNVFSSLVGPSSDTEGKKSIDLLRLFQWSLNPSDYAGSVPPSYFSFREMHGLWTLPFLLIGIIFLVLRREERDVFLIAWLVSLYIALHRDIFGITFFLHRSLSATAHIFAPLTAIGAVYLANAVKLPSNYNKYLKYMIAAVFVYLALSINMASASKMLNKNTYNDFFGTLNQEEYEAAQWVLENVPQSVNVTVLGIPYQSNVLSVTSKKIRWFAAVSQHVTRFYYYLENKEEVLKSKEWYVMLDYTMLPALKDVETFNNMQKFESEALANHTLAYNKNNIRVYKLAK